MRILIIVYERNNVGDDENEENYRKAKMVADLVFLNMFKK